MKLNSTYFRQTHRSLAAIAVILAAAPLGCSSNSTQDSVGVEVGGDEHAHGPSGEHSHGEGSDGQAREGQGEHARDGEGGQKRDGEESGTELSLADRYDNVRNGARLILAYDAENNSFDGTVENTTEETLERVRVEVHLSNGKELGPTTPTNLQPGEKRKVTLQPESKGFDGWTAHPEVGNEEHGHGEGGEHGRRERGEHSREGRGEHSDGDGEGG